MISHTIQLSAMISFIAGAMLLMAHTLHSVRLLHCKATMRQPDAFGQQRELDT